MSSSPLEATVVMVHGAWADGSSWRRVILGLQGKVRDAIAAPIPLTSLSDDIAALDRVVERTAGPVVLVAHAYAGAVIGGSRSARKKALVYVAALAPDQGETVADVFYKNASHPLAPEMKPDTNGLIWMPDSGFQNAFAQDADADTLAVFRAAQRPLSVACIQEPVTLAAWKEVRSFFLVATEDRMINPETQRFMAGRMNATVHEAAVDHTPLMTSPERVVDLIVDAAASLNQA